MLKIAIVFPFRPNDGSGGAESASLALLKALDDLREGDEEFLVVCRSEYAQTLASLLVRRTRIVVKPEPDGQRLSWRRRLSEPARRLVLRLAAGTGHEHRWPEVPLSDGFYESLGVDVLHFPFQGFELCAVPTVYNPHDLQHRHLPQYFSAGTLADREVRYRAGCTLSRVVVVASEWIRQDVIREYSVHPSKVIVVPWAAPTSIWPPPSQEDVEEVRSRYGLPKDFLLYPAMTWPHKNHLTLLRSLAALRRTEGRPVRLVCTGSKTEYFSVIERELDALGLRQEVQFTGMLAPRELIAVYAMAAVVVVPTLFEAASGPLFEAWLAGVPAVVSNVTSLPEQAAGAAVLVDPRSVEQLTAAIEKVLGDESLRRELVEAGRRRLEDFSWEKTARGYVQAYRMAAGLVLERGTN